MDTGGRDLGAALIDLRRTLPESVALVARLGADPSAGMVLQVPDDPAWAIEVRPSDAGWDITELHRLSEPLGEQRRTITADHPPAAVADTIAAAYRQLQRQVRNAACGTPLERR